MHKILATLIAGLFATGAYAQTPAPAKTSHKKVAKKKAHKAVHKAA